MQSRETFRTPRPSDISPITASKNTGRGRVQPQNGMPIADPGWFPD